MTITRSVIGTAMATTLEGLVIGVSVMIELEPAVVVLPVAVVVIIDNTVVDSIVVDNIVVDSTPVVDGMVVGMSVVVSVLVGTAMATTFEGLVLIGVSVTIELEPAVVVLPAVVVVVVDSIVVDNNVVDSTLVVDGIVVGMSVVISVLWDKTVVENVVEGEGRDAGSRGTVMTLVPYIRGGLLKSVVDSTLPERRLTLVAV